MMKIPDFLKVYSLDKKEIKKNVFKKTFFNIWKGHLHGNK